MNAAILEHINLTVKDPKATAEKLCALFDWRIRWEGDAIHGGHTVHVGGEHSYLALYAGADTARHAQDNYTAVNGLNHLGIVVQDLDETERRVVAAGFKPHLHANYDPGKRFYFKHDDELEIEVVQY